MKYYIAIARTDKRLPGSWASMHADEKHDGEPNVLIVSRDELDEHEVMAADKVLQEDSEIDLVSIVVTENRWAVLCRELGH